MHRSWTIRETSWPLTTESTVYAFAGAGELAWLDSAITRDLHTAAARYSLICRHPVAVLLQHCDTPATLSIGGRTVAEDASGWALWPVG